LSFGRFDETRDDEGNRDFIKVSKPRPGTTLVTMDRPERMNSMAFEQVIPCTRPSRKSRTTTRQAWSC